MSKKKILNLIELIANVLLLADMAILPYAYIVIDPVFEWAIEKRVQQGLYTFFGHTKQMPNLLTVFFIVLIAANAVMCLASFVGKSLKKDGAIHVVIPAIALVLGLFFYQAGYSLTGYDNVIDPVTKAISVALIISLAVFGVMKRSNAVFPRDEVVAVVNEVKASDADELKKYKDLLDSGVISQEEFDAKKKQLLGL